MVSRVPSGDGQPRSVEKQSPDQNKPKTSFKFRDVVVLTGALVGGVASAAAGTVSGVALAVSAVVGPVMTITGAALFAEPIIAALIVLATPYGPLMTALAIPMSAVGLAIVAMGVASVALPALAISAASAAFVIAAIITVSYVARAGAELDAEKAAKGSQKPQATPLGT